MIGESVVAELKELIAHIGFAAAVWEWSVWDKGDRPRLHFLKITLLPAREDEGRTTLFSSAGLSLYRSTTPIKSVIAFIDYCLSTRRLFEENRNAMPVEEPGFELGPHRVPLFGNFPSNRPEFYSSWQASRSWFYKSRRPFFFVSYALHDSAKARIPSELTLHGGSPPFASPREAYKHYFSVDIGEGRDTWTGILAPIHVARIKSYRRVDKKLVVEVDVAKRMPHDLFLSVVCRRKGRGDFRRRVLIDRKNVTFPVVFKPESIDLALYLDELRIDFLEWHAPRRHVPIPTLTPAILDDPPAYQHVVFGSDFLKRQHPDVRACLEQANDCAVHNLWVPATLVLRKALEIAVNLKLKQLGKNDEIYTDGYEKSLPARLDLLGRELPEIRRELPDILTIKWFGDKGAHSRMALYEGDVRSVVAPRLRSFLTVLDLRSRAKSR